MPDLSEKLAATLVAAGVLMLLLGFVWLVVRAFRDGVWWGLAVLLVLCCS